MLPAQHALHTSLIEEYRDEVAFNVESQPSEEDYNAKMRGEASCGEQMYEFRAYAPTVFRKLRRKRGLDNLSFATSMRKLSGGAVGEGKSGMVFFMSEDKRYIIKTVKESEKKFCKSSQLKLDIVCLRLYTHTSHFLF